MQSDHRLFFYDYDKTNDGVVQTEDISTPLCYARYDKRKGSFVKGEF